MDKEEAFMESLHEQTIELLQGSKKVCTSDGLIQCYLLFEILDRLKNIDKTLALLQSIDETLATWNREDWERHNLS